MQAEALDALAARLKLRIDDVEEWTVVKCGYLDGSLRVLAAKFQQVPVGPAGLAAGRVFCGLGVGIGIHIACGSRFRCS